MVVGGNQFASIAYLHDSGNDRVKKSILVEKTETAGKSRVPEQEKRWDPVQK